jgi:hypothetical protein
LGAGRAIFEEMTMFRKLHSAIAVIVILGAAVTSASATPNQVCYFGECNTGTAATDIPAINTHDSARSPMLPGHGSWTGGIAPGERTFIVDNFEDGSAFAIGDDGQGKIALTIARSSWQMRPGQTFGMKIDIDDWTFRGTVAAIDEQTLRLDDVRPDFVTALMQGEKGSIQVKDFSAEMSNLRDAAMTILDVARMQKTSAR